MKKMRFVLFLTLLALLLSAMALPASADVIFEPLDDFYASHREDCVHEWNRRYIANSEKGFIYLYQSPVSGITKASFSNGEELSASFVYTASNGDRWGFYQVDSPERSVSGWFRMADVSLVYDSAEFVREHQGEMTSYVQGSHIITAGPQDPVYVWEYPGGARMGFTLSTTEFLQGVQSTYTDASGNVWGYLSYLYGIRGAWVCLSDPHSTEVGGYAVEEHAIQLKNQPVAHERIPMSDGNRNMLILTGVLVAAVVGGSAVAILLVYRKKKTQPQALR